MNPPRSLLNIEMFEDRLLPSTIGIDGFDPNSAFATNSLPVPAWHPRDAAEGDSGGVENFLLRSSTNPNSTNGFQNQAIGSEDAAFTEYSINLNSVSFSPGSPLGGFRDGSWQLESSDNTPNNLLINSAASNNNLVSGGAYSPQPLAVEDSSPQPVLIVIVGFDGNVLNRFADFRNAADSPDVRWQPLFNRDNQTSGTNPADGLNGSPTSGSAGDSGSTQLNAVVPFGIVALTAASLSETALGAAASTPEQFLASVSLQTAGGQAIASEQLHPNESHSLLSDMNLAAVSLVPSQAVPLSIPMLPSVVGVYPNSPAGLSLPRVVAERATLNVKAPPALRTTEVAEMSVSPPTIEIQAPAGALVEGAISLDAVELDGRVSRVLASISNLSEELTEELEQPEAYAWLVAAGLLSLGAGYAAWINQKSQRIVRFSLGRGSLSAWECEGHDTRNRR